MNTKAIVLYPYLKGNETNRSPDSILDEVVALTKAIDLSVFYSEVLPLREIKVNAHLGKGTIERLYPMAHQADVVIMACHLSPLQQRNLEKAWIYN